MPGGKWSQTTFLASDGKFHPTHFGLLRSGSTRPAAPSPTPEHGDDLAPEALAAEGKTAVRRSADLRPLHVDERRGKEAPVSRLGRLLGCHQASRRRLGTDNTHRRNDRGGKS